MRDKIDVFLSILGNVATVLTNSTIPIPGLGRVIALVQYAGGLLQNISIGVDRLKEVDEEIKRLVAEGRAPTDEEWAVWENRLAASDVRFAKIKESLG